MGAVADAALDAGGHVIGVIPHVLVDKEVSHNGCTELHVVDTMHTRKALMGERADAFLILPGGYGTFEELFEVLAWQTLRLHSKPMCLLKRNPMPRSKHKPISVTNGIAEARRASSHDARYRRFMKKSPKRNPRRNPKFRPSRVKDQAGSVIAGTDATLERSRFANRCSPMRRMSRLNSPSSNRHR